MKDRWKILVVDDEPSMRASLSAWLEEDGYEVSVAASGAEAIEAVRAEDFAVCFVDLKMPGARNGIDTLKEIGRLRPDTRSVIMTAYATVDTAVTAMKEGAHDYLVKPFNPEEASLLTRRILAVREIERENRYLRKKLSRRFEFRDIISRNSRMQEVFELIRQVADLPSPVLIFGESGTGKELVARALHESGDRCKSPIATVSCAALGESVLESELFGHEPDAVPGARTRREGKLEQADGGTLFLDGIGDLPAKLQRDLLRVLQDKSITRVGGAEEIPIDVRIVAATTRDLEQEVEDGAFRRDLYYRLNVISLRIPPLRDRREDIPLLVPHFMRRLSLELGLPEREVRDDALAALMDWSWPGNVRELENAMERAMATGGEDPLTAETFTFLGAGARLDRAGGLPTDLTLAEIERRVIPAVLGRTGGNVKAAAEILGIDRSTLYDKLKRYGIERPRRT